MLYLNNTNIIDLFNKYIEVLPVALDDAGTIEVCLLYLEMQGE